MEGGWYPSMHCRWYPSMPCSRGVLSEHALQQGSAPGGCLIPGGFALRGVLPGGCGDPPKSRWLPLQTVHILLECILVFLHVCDSVHRGVGVGGIPAYLTAGLWGDLQAHTQGAVEASGQGGLQAHTWGGVSQYALRQTPPMDGYCHRQYLSYWNAFLFIKRSNGGWGCVE